MKELNPNHPVTREVHDHWHKLCALALHKLGVSKVSITSADIESFSRKWVGRNGQDGAITVHPTGNVLTLELVNGDDAARIARKEGGLPV
jgi:hypothetical protein